MRRCFRKAGVPSPDFLIVRDSPGPALPLTYPVVVKPVDNMGARGCRRADGPEELRDAVEDALGFSRSHRAIVEEYMEGPEFSVDAIVYQGEITVCGLADRHIFFPPYFIEMGHTMPTSVDAGTAEALLTVVKVGVKAVGITNGAAKGDIKLTPSGPMIGEIAARLSGGYMSGWTYPYASGVEPTRGAIQVALGEVPAGLVPTRDWTSAERAFISIPGRVHSIHGLDEAKSIEHVKDLFLRIKPGDRVRFPENNVTKCGNVISAAPDPETAVAAAERAARSVLICLEAPDPETDRFLSFSTAFPPDAFPVSDKLREALAALPDPESGRPGMVPFPEFSASGLRDYMGRSVEESLEAVRLLTGLGLTEDGCFGRCFWAALIRGGYQGAVFLLKVRGVRVLAR
jgi:biotin carboxylase